MVDVLEEPRDIHIYEPFHPRPYGFDVFKRRMTRPARPESMGGVREHRFIDPFEQLPRHFLNEAVVARGNAQRTPFALAFRDKHPTHWFGIIGPCRHAGDNRVEVFRSEVREGLAVNTRRHRTLVGSDLLEPLLPKEARPHQTIESIHPFARRNERRNGLQPAFHSFWQHQHTP